MRTFVYNHKMLIMKRLLILSFLALASLTPVSCKKEKPEDKIVVPEGAVDMGIVMTREDGSTYRLFWAKCNLGAIKADNLGDLYAWGETEPIKAGMSLEDHLNSYKFSDGYESFKVGPDSYEIHLRLTKYCTSDKTDHWGGMGPIDNKTNLKDYNYTDDAARVRLGGKWRIPTAAEWKALIDNCICERHIYEDITREEYRYFEFTSRINGQKLIIPAAGHSRDERAINAYYWASDIDPDYPTNAKIWIYHINKIVGIGNQSRWLGLSIRPVIEE